MNQFPSSALVLDLETIPLASSTEPDRIHMLGAMRSDINEGIEIKINKTNSLEKALEALEKLIHGADCVVGHNILAHDLPVLAAHNNSLGLLKLPVVDTLLLSPLSFPQNPYHRLIKNYKLISDSLNSPLADCRATWELLADQKLAFQQLSINRKSELLCYQGLLGTDMRSGIGAFFASVTGQPALPLNEIAEMIPVLLLESDPSLSRDMKVCRTRLDFLLKSEIYENNLRWPLAYALAWFRVSGGNSVLAPWVHHQYPETWKMIHELRDIPCGIDTCQYCTTTHDPRHELKRYFGFPDFRYESESNRESRQYDTVLAGMRGENVLAVLPTGGGKSLCYQLPALNRFYRNNSLTIIISPLQSLMKDQVDGLLERNIGCAAALNGLLSLPERAEVLDKIQMGDIGILLVSPEQFRNQGFRNAIAQRRIGAWIFDEAHCLSKWGHDFRPDYLYAARFISEFTNGDETAPIGCFTATAKPEVLEDIRQHFREHLQVEFSEFIGNPERTNLSFDVLPCSANEKWGHVIELLNPHLGENEGGAVVFVASRRKAEELSQFIIDQAWACAHFHAGLEPNQKKDVQDAFKAGDLRVIVATNAFGMGVDKADIRLVLHADIPGSLENYLQEAGRAGRDQKNAHCVLLYDPNDIETQFGLTERSRLTFRDIQQILRKLRYESRRRKGASLVITAGEILRDEGVDTSFDMEDRDAETKIVTAVSWLERGDYLKREVNVTKIFPAKLGASEGNIEDILSSANLSPRKKKEFLNVLGFLQKANPDQRISTDQLLQVNGQTLDEVVGMLRQMEELGLLVNDTQLTIYLRHGVENSAKDRIQKTAKLEKALFEQLAEYAPDANNGEWQDLHLSTLTHRLKECLGSHDLLPIEVFKLLKSLARDKGNDAGQRSSFEIKPINADYLKLRILNGYNWRQLEGLGERRRALSQTLLDYLVKKLPSDIRSTDALVETSFGELENQIAEDMHIAAVIPKAERRRAVEHVLLYLHQQDILVLNHGMTVMRRAMTIEVNEEKGKYLKSDFSRLEEHYNERIIQVHVMRQYAETAKKDMADALQLVIDYFAQDKAAFLKRYFSNKKQILKRATSEESWESIVGPLSAEQKKAVVDEEDSNRLILAGPGSGKTRVIVHRIAYLLRVNRIPSRAIVALAFNRHAANEIRKRLYKLIGNDAYGVTVLTYHSLAMRMTGVSFERHETIDEDRLNKVLTQAVDLLEAKDVASGDNDLRDQLMGGYRYILVDEYQDIDDIQYRLISALAGRNIDKEQRLCILAVGDDDQNIYAWRNTSNRYIERFQNDYKAEILYLIENYRSSRNIIEAANNLISRNQDRLKKDYPIVINNSRRNEDPAGDWKDKDTSVNGKVLRLIIPNADMREGNLQAQAAISRLQSLMLAGNREWSGCAILARNHKYLAPVQAWCEQNDIQYHMAGDRARAPALTRQRQFVQFIEQLNSLEIASNAEDITALITGLNIDSYWRGTLSEALEQLKLEFGDVKLKGEALIDWLYEYFRDTRQKPAKGLYLGTVHSTKGLEFSHVVILDGGWQADYSSLEDETRLYYVGMTRAEHTLTLCEFSGGNLFSSTLESVSATKHGQGQYDPNLCKRYLTLAPSEVDIGYAGRFDASAEIHRHIAQLSAGSSIHWREQNGRFLLLDAGGHVIGRTALSFSFSGTIESSHVSAVIVRYASDSDEKYLSRIKTDSWEVILPTVILDTTNTTMIDE